MKDEKFILEVAMELYWAGFRTGEKYAKGGQPLTVLEVDERNKLIIKCQKKLLRRLQAGK